jgi:antitoxin (DNA-binding transcriptional repressor) of toxin-antitoxin stability system
MPVQHEQALSVKELRTQFPSVAERLKHGQEFILIHRSKPIGRLLPYSRWSQESSDALSFFAKPPRSAWVKGKKSSVALVRADRS